MSEVMEATELDDSALAQLFGSARSLHTFSNRPVSDETLRSLYDLWKLGPTAFNSQPARVVFVRSSAGKQRLAPALAQFNRDKTMKAPVTAIIAYDMRFYEHLPTQFPGANVRSMFVSDPVNAEQTAFRNGSLQGAYLMIAARALGLAVGPMSGFNAEAINRAFFADGRYRVNFLVNIGYHDGTIPRSRGPRLRFEDAVQFA